MSRKTWGIILIVVGVLLALLSALADVIGVGGTPGMGFAQIAGLVVGIAGVVVGIYLMVAAPAAK
jgi:hypothetical protein